MSTSLEDRVEQLEARFAIMDLVADYSAAIDCRDLERFLACFTRDGVIRHADRSMRVEGREALRDYYTRRFGEYGMTFHYIPTPTRSPSMAGRRPTARSRPM